MSVGRTIRALPTMLRIGVAETVAYRAEFLVWILTTTMPLVQMALWTTVAKNQEFQGYGQADFVAYFLGVLIVRNVAGSWVGWQISEEIRMGTMAMRLLRPVHPFITLAASHIASIPFRTVVMLPLAFILLISSGGSALTREPLQLALLVPALVVAWMITFAMMFAIGCLAFFITRAMGLFSLYFLVFTLLSGYMMPLALLPEPLWSIAEWTPFRFMLSFPVELMTASFTPERLALMMAVQVGWMITMIALAMYVWRLGIRRFEAVGS